MQLGISVNDDIESLLRQARWAEANGLVRLAVPDHLLRAHAVDPALAATSPAPDPFVQLAAAATVTTTIGLATLCCPVTFRHPAHLLKAAIELSVLSHGRFTLGVGAGYRAAEHEMFGIPFPPSGERFAMLEEQLEYLVAGRSPEHPGHIGVRYRLAAHPIAPRPDRLRYLVGGSGASRTPDLAGWFADEYNLFLTDTGGMRRRIARARTAHAAAERQSELTISVAAPLITGATRREVSNEAERQAAVQGLTSDELLARHEGSGSALVGTHDAVADRLIELAGLGVQACTFVFDGPIDQAGVLAVRDACRQT